MKNDFSLGSFLVNYAANISQACLESVNLGPDCLEISNTNGYLNEAIDVTSMIKSEKTLHRLWKIGLYLPPIYVQTTS